MLVVAARHTILMWLRFSRLQFIGRGRLFILIGTFILAASAATLNHPTPSGSSVSVSRIGEVTPNVPVRTAPVLFRIDPAPRRSAQMSRDR